MDELNAALADFNQTNNAIDTIREKSKRVIMALDAVASAEKEGRAKAEARAQAAEARVAQLEKQLASTGKKK